MKYGYARVSTDDQNPALQLAALKKAGCQTVFKDEGIGGATMKRPALARCLDRLEAGDTLIVWKLDRLGRSLRDLIAMLGEDANHLPHGAPRRGFRVDRLGERPELNAAVLEIIEHRDQVAKRAAQAIEFPNGQRVPRLQSLETAEQGRALRRRAREFILEDSFASGLF